MRSVALLALSIWLPACMLGGAAPGVLVLDAASGPPLGGAPAARGGGEFNLGTPGERVSLVIAGADLKTTLFTIAQLGGINVSVDREVWGDNLKARFIDVPWDMALAALLQSHNLSIKKVGSVYRIGPRDKLSQEREEGVGEVGRADVKTHFIKLAAAPASEVAPVVKELLLSPWGSVIPYAPANLLIVRDEDRVVVRIKEFVERLEQNRGGPPPPG